MNRRTTITDVAKHAGVGKVTVSYVLNGRSRSARISDETAKRVLESASELNYRPNAIARMLVTKRTDTIAVVFQRGEFFSSWSSFTSEVMRGVAAAAVESGFDLMLHTKSLSEPHSESDVLSDGRVDGALVLRDEGDPTLVDLLSRGFPTVQFFTRSDQTGASFVDADNYSGGLMATQHLIELGHKRIGMIVGPSRSTASNDRFNGFKDALDGAGLELDERNVVTMTEPGRPPEAFLEMMRRPNRVATALFAWSDDVAQSCMVGIRELGLQIPADVSIVGFDSLDICERSSPPLTSVRQPIFDMANLATKMLVDLIQGGEPVSRQVIFPLSLDLRGSTAPCLFSN